MANGPRIYNLFPLLAGSIDRWQFHLPRIRALGFDWIYLNPVSYPGFSGSLYAVKDYYRLHPLVQGESDQPAGARLGAFLQAASGEGIKVMLDLVVNHTSKDALLVQEHPEFYMRKPDGELLPPHAVDPVDPTLITEWGDLAEIDYDGPHRHAVAEWFKGLAVHYAQLGCAGFRCDAAYKVPADVWRIIIAGVREARPGCLFFAETLGCTTEQVEALASAGFDYLFNSAKWWDFQAPWLLDQINQFRTIAPSIAFPESHDTDRLVNELPAGVDAPAHYRRQALLSAFISAGWMMPMGYEVGAAKRLDVVQTRPEDWPARPAFDLSDWIGALNRAKAGLPVLNTEAAIERLTPQGKPVVVLAKRQQGQAAVLVLNAGAEPQELDLKGLLAREGFEPSALVDATPQGPGGALPDRLALAPVEARLFATPMSGGGGGLMSADPVDPLAEAVAQGSVTILDVQPQLECGRYPVKREVGDLLEVSADILLEGHDKLAAVVRWKHREDAGWSEVPMHLADNDRWVGRVPLTRNTRVLFTVESWRDGFASWRSDTLKKREAGQDIGLELAEGRHQLDGALARASGDEAERLRRILADLDRSASDEDRADLMLSTVVRRIMARLPDRAHATRFGRVLQVIVDRPLARFGAWYELMVRSQGTDPARSATFHDAQKRLPEIQRMGFDVVYLLPIHPIGRKHRKGPNNSLTAGPNDPGSPYAIGAAEGGHDAIHPDLGTLEDFRAFVKRARQLNLEVALDFAVQCAPDHPWIKDHPDWFVFRPDGTIRYAENPPKKYQDIVNVNFHGGHAGDLWRELLRVVLFWVEQGVTIFRVDNPHTKPVAFWEWLIARVQENHPEVIFLSEAFTRPKMMHLLAKAGFTQSYTYFTWRNFKQELADYGRELAEGPGRDYFRPNFFPTTPDILPPFLVTGGRPAFLIRLVLAATMAPTYGLYNSYELCENEAVPGKEEYLNSEKYQYKVWDWNRPGHIKDEITRLNLIRRENPALQELENLRFHDSSDENILFYGKMTLDRSNMVFVAVNLDPFDAHEADLAFPLDAMGVPKGETYEVEELLTGRRHLWRGSIQTVTLDPLVNPAAIYRVTVWNSVDYRSPCY